MQIWKVSEYSKIPNIPGFFICKCYTRFWTCLNMAKKFLNKQFWYFHRVLNVRPVLNMPELRIWQTCEYVRVTQVGEYAWIMLNMLEYACIYPNKQSSECAKILNMCDAVHSLRSLYKLLSSYRDRFSEHCQTSKTEGFAKRIMPECTHATRNFSL